MGAFLDDVGGFDCDFFGMTEREAIAVDPQHRLLLETSWDAVEHAGLAPGSLAQTQTGVFVGLTHGDYELLSADCGAAEGPYGFTGTSNSFASGRVAYALGLHGPAVTVDTACSSGLMAVHQACGSLAAGESDLALAGGVVVTLEPRKSVSGSLQGMLSPTGRCHAFDVRADGFVSGEGCVMLLLKPLDDAQRDGDRILAVLRGTAANQDGRTVNIAAPSETAQVAVYRKALGVADIDPRTIGYVEAHGTGTPVGDPIEFSSLAAVYGTDGPCVLGSVKTNFGHMQSTSGPLGLMKAILALQHGVVPRNLHFTRLPDEMARIETDLFVPQSNTPWPTGSAHPAAPRCRPMECPAPTCTPSWSRRRQTPPRGYPMVRTRPDPLGHNYFRCRPPRPSSCASRPPGSRVGSTSSAAPVPTATPAPPCGIWATRYRAAARTDRYGRWCARTPLTS